MPLHLLGKKSWNVYNTDNIERVRKDEAAAQAKEQEEERQWQDTEAENRLRLLRGENALETTNTHESNKRTPPRSNDEARKKRKRVGEDDTDRDIRLARDDINFASQVVLKGQTGLIQGDSTTNRKARDTDQPEAEGMRFKDASGYNKDGTKPWYANQGVGSLQQERLPSQDVWGNEDPRRRERETKRMNADDPLMAMKRGVKQLREHEKERNAWRQQRERDLNEVEEMAQRQKKHKKSRRHDIDEDIPDGFNLDKSYTNSVEDDGHRDRRRGQSSDHHKHHNNLPSASHPQRSDRRSARARTKRDDDWGT